MSVNLKALHGDLEQGVCNASWMAVVELARVYERDKIPAWNGCHDGQEWTPEQLRIMADRLEQTAFLITTLRRLAEQGGVVIS